MRILVDMDGIAVNLLDPWLNAYNLESGDCLQRHAVDKWDIHGFVDPDYGKRIYDILRRPGFFDYLPAMGGAVEGITQLYDDGHDVRFCTAPPCPDAARGKIEWVMRHFKHLGWGMEHVLQMHDKHWLNADILIDDKPQTINEWAAKTDAKIMSILHPYNKHVAHKCYVMASDAMNPEVAWDRLVKEVRKI